MTAVQLDRRLLVPLAMVALLVAGYGSGFGGPFIYDDLHAIVENDNLSDLSRLGRVLHGAQQETRPVYVLSLALNRAVGGLEPAGYRAVNLALHLGCALLLLSLAHRMLGDLRRRAGLDGAAPAAPLVGLPEIAALLFLVHPIATESVTYVNSRSGLLAAAFGLAGVRLALAALDEHARAGGRFAGRAALSVLCMALAMGSKESAVVFPVLLALYLWIFRGAAALTAALRRPWSLPALLVCTLLVPLWFVLFRSPHPGTIGGDALPWLDHLLTQPRVLVSMLGLLVWPAALNIDHDLPLSRGLGWPESLALLLLIGLFAGAFWLRRRAPVAAFGALWFFVALAPTNSFVPFHDYFAERHLYLASGGFALVVAAGASGLVRRTVGRPAARATLAATGLILLLAFTARTAARNSVLADPLHLWTETVAASPDKARPHVNLAMYLLEAGRLEEAGQQLAAAVRLDPSDGRAQFNYGLWLRQSGRWDEALAALRLAVEGPAPRAIYRRALARTATHLASEALEAGDAARAESLLREALAANPDEAEASALLQRLPR